MEHQCSIICTEGWIPQCRGKCYQIKSLENCKQLEKNYENVNEKLKEAIELLRKNNKSGNSIITNKTDELIKILITEVDKRLPRKRRLS